MKARFRIRTKLLAGYLTAALFTLLAAAAGMAGMTAMNGRSGAMFENVVQPLKLFHRMDNDFLNLQIELRNLVLEPSALDDPAALKRIDGLQQNFYRLSGTVLDAITDGETRSGFAEFQNALRAYIGDSKTFIDLIAEGRNEEALALLNGDMGASAALATGTLTDILDRTAMAGDAFTEANVLSLKKVTAAFSALILTGLFVSLFIGFSLARYFNGAIGELSRLMAEMARGDMTGAVNRRHASLSDELGDLLRSAAALQADLRDCIRASWGPATALTGSGARYSTPPGTTPPPWGESWSRYRAWKPRALSLRTAFRAPPPPPRRLSAESTPWTGRSRIRLRG